MAKFLSNNNWLLTILFSCCISFVLALASPVNAEEQDGLYLYDGDTLVSDSTITCYLGETTTLTTKVIKDGSITEIENKNVTWTQSEEVGKKATTLDEGRIRVPVETVIGANGSDRCGVLTAEYDGMKTSVTVYARIKIKQDNLTGSMKVDELKNWTLDYYDGLDVGDGNREAFCNFIKENLKVTSSNAEVVPEVTLNVTNTSDGILSCVISATPIAEGAVKFTYTIDDCILTSDKTVSFDAFYLTTRSLGLQINEVSTISCSEIKAPSSYPTQVGDIVWETNDETVATVDNTGKVTGIAKGKATIKATATFKNKKGTKEKKYSRSCAVYVANDGIYRASTLSADLTNLDGPLKEVTLNGADERLYLYAVRNGRSVTMQSLHSDDSGVVTNNLPDTGAESPSSHLFYPKANGEATVYIYERDVANGVSEELGTIKVRVTGMDNDAVDKHLTVTPVTGAQGDSTTIELNGYTLENYSRDQHIYDNHIEGAAAKKNLVFNFTVTGTGKNYDEDAVNTVSSINFRNSYLSSLSDYIELIDQSGNVIATPNNSMMTITGDTSLDVSPTANIAIAIDNSCIKPNTKYTLRFKRLTPVPYYHTVEMFLEKEALYSFQTEKLDLYNDEEAVIDIASEIEVNAMPNLTVSYGDTKLAVDTDYTVTYQDADGNDVTALDKAGTYTAVIKGKGDYEGTVEKKFSVKAAETPSSGGGSSSGGGATPSTPSEPTPTDPTPAEPTVVTIPVTDASEDSNVSNVTATIDDAGEVTITEITEAALEKVAEGDALTIDLSNLTSVSEDTSAVTLTTDTVQNLADSGAGSLEIKLDTASAQIDKDTLKAVAQQAAGSSVRLEIVKDSKAEQKMVDAQKSAVKKMKNATTLDASFTSGGRKIENFKGGIVKLIVPMQTSKKVRGWYVPDNGSREKVACEYDAKALTVTLSCSHFSVYAIEQYLDNTVTVKGKTVKVKAAKVKKKAQTVKASKALKVSKAKGTVTYKKVSGKKNFKVNKKTGKITIKKGTKKGTYKVKIKVAAAGDADYLAASKTVTVKIRVK